MSDETGARTPTDSAVRRAARESRFGRLWTRTVAAVRGSYLYRWLTAEPDPEVIVIDLRETWTVGPFIRLLDAVLDRLVPALGDSRVATAARGSVRHTLAAPAVVAGLALLAAGLGLGLVSVAGGTLGTTRLGVATALAVAGVVATRERRSWAELRETRPVELLVAALEPPEPPERADAGPDATETGRDSASVDEGAAGTDATDADTAGADATDADTADSDATGADLPEAEQSAEDRARSDP